MIRGVSVFSRLTSSAAPSSTPIPGGTDCVAGPVLCVKNEKGEVVVDECEDNVVFEVFVMVILFMMFVRSLLRSNGSGLC